MINGGGQLDTVNFNTSLNLGSAVAGNTGNLSVTAHSILVSSPIVSTGNIVATSTGSILINGIVSASGDVTLSATGLTSDVSIGVGTGVRSTSGGNIFLRRGPYCDDQ